MGQVLPKGTYRAFPDLKPGQERASVSVEIRLAGGGAPTAGPSGAGSPFDGKWPGTKRQHTDCGYSAVSDLEFTTDGSGRTRVLSNWLGETDGTVVGRVYTFRYGIVDGTPSGEVTLRLSDDGRSFTGTFASRDGHKGTMSGTRAGDATGPSAGSSPIDGLWPGTKRQHTDCGYSAVDDIAISTDAQGVARITSTFWRGATGKVVGRRCTFRLVDEAGVPTGTATLDFSEDGRSFRGTFASKDGHTGNIQGSR